MDSTVLNFESEMLCCHLSFLSPSSLPSLPSLPLLPLQLGKQCQDLLMTVAVNCHTHSPEDLRVIDALINVRLKTKLFSNQFVACIRSVHS